MVMGDILSGSIHQSSKVVFNNNLSPNFLGYLEPYHQAPKLNNIRITNSHMLVIFDNPFTITIIQESTITNSNNVVDLVKQKSRSNPKPIKINLK